MILYSTAVGSLIYAMVCTRHDIAHAIGLGSKFMSNLGKEHWSAVKWILHHLKGFVDIGILFDKGSSHFALLC